MFLVNNKTYIYHSLFLNFTLRQFIPQKTQDILRELNKLGTVFVFPMLAGLDSCILSGCINIKMFNDKFGMATDHSEEIPTRELEECLKTCSCLPGFNPSFSGS